MITAGVYAAFELNSIKVRSFPYYKESQYPTIKADEEEEYLLKPMNCPHHIEIYAAEKHSYRELPIRLAEFGAVIIKTKR